MIFIRHRKTVLSAYLALVSLALFSCASPNPDAVPVTHMGVKAYGDTTTMPVRVGDTVYIMSQRLGVDMRALIDSNQLKPPYRIYPGQRLRVPTPPAIHAQKGDSLYSIARAYNADQSEIVRLNGLKPPYRLALGQRIKLPSVPVSSAAIVTTAANKVPVLVDEPIYDVGQISTAQNTTRNATPADKTSAQNTMSQKELAASLSAAAGTGTSSASTHTDKDLPAPGALKKEDSMVLARTSPNVLPKATTAKPTSTTASKPTGKQTSKSKTTSATAAAPRFSWPVNGSILSDFGPKTGGRHNDGLNIGAPLGSPVRAAAAGEVVYTGNKVAGFGNLILIRHNGGYATAYAHVQKPLVKRGQTISAGQAIASIGKTGNVSTPQLHFEIRKGTKPVNPKTYLP